MRAGHLDADATAAVLAAAGHRPAKRREWPAGLTTREVEILRLVARGQTNKQIAATLTISPKTAGTHVEHIYTKLGVTNRALASLFAAKHGLITAGTHRRIRQKSGEHPIPRRTNSRTVESMTYRISASAHVSADRDALFAQITDLGRLPQWNRAITEVIVAPDAPLCSGSIWKVKVHAMGTQLGQPLRGLRR